MERKFHLFWAVLADSGFPPGRGIVRFYAAFEAGDSDGDGLNDVFETLALGTSTNSPDSDGDGVDDATEYAAGINLYDWPDLPGGGPNEVRLGRTDHPFRVEWEWWIPIEMQMEPIYSSLNLPLSNPSGIILGSNAIFSVMVEPLQIVPGSKIVWTSAFNKVEFIGSHRGWGVEVCATNIGEDKLCVSVEGAIGGFNLPPFNIKVMPLTVVTAKVGIVTKNGVGAIDSNSICQALSHANAVLCQAGRQIEVHWPAEEIPDENGFWEVDCSNGSIMTTLCNKMAPFGGLKVIFVYKMTLPNGDIPGGASLANGLLINSSRSMTTIGRTWAHEFCHACGLRDLFITDGGTSLSGVGEISENRMPEDWGHYDIGTTNGPRMEDIARRLSMFWQAESDDIPSGRVYGLWYTRVTGGRQWHLSNGPVGLSDMTNAPVHQ